MPTAPTPEHATLLETLAKHRALLVHTTAGLSDEQAAASPTASALSLGGLIKHVTRVQQRWTNFMLGGAEAMEATDGDGVNAFEAHMASFQMTPDDSLSALLSDFAAGSAATDAALCAVTDLGTDHALPSAPWFEPGARWSARRVGVHLVAEISQHAGHADIIRETIDGQKSMG